MSSVKDGGKCRQKKEKKELRTLEVKTVGKNNCRPSTKSLDAEQNAQHRRRLLRDYVTYYHHDRIHDSLAKDTSHQPPVEQRPAANAGVISMPPLGGLQHRYAWREAA